MVVTDLVDDLLVEVPFPVEDTLARAARFTLTEFFRDSESWRETYAITLDSALLSYAIPIPADTSCVATLSVYLIQNNKRYRLVAVRPHQLKPDENSSRPYSFAVEGSTLWLDGSGDGELEVIVALAPSARVEVEFPDALGEQNFEYLRAGALSRILAMTDKEWSNPRQAERNRLLFEDGKVRAKRDARGVRNRPIGSIRYGGL